MSEKPFVKNAADKNQVKGAGRKERDLRRQQVNDLRVILKLPEGQRFLWRVIHDLCHVDKPSAIQNSGSMTYLTEGERAVGLIVKAEVFEADLATYQKMEATYIQGKLDKDAEGE